MPIIRLLFLPKWTFFLGWKDLFSSLPHIFWLIYDQAAAALPSVSLYIFPLSADDHQAKAHFRSQPKKIYKNASPNSAHHYAGKEKKITTAGLWVEGRKENPSCFSKLLIYQLKKHLRTSPPGEKYIHFSVVLLITPNSFLKCAHSCMLGEASEVGGGGYL